MCATVSETAEGRIGVQEHPESDGAGRGNTPRELGAGIRQDDAGTDRTQTAMGVSW